MAKLSPPWWEFYNKLVAMFGQDPEIHLEFKDEEVIKMYVDNQAKADALTQVLPAEKDFGNVKIKIEIIPSDKASGIEQLYKTIFNGNPVFSQTCERDVEGMPHALFVIFKPLVVQFYDDNLTDAYGNFNGLHQEIARDLFVGKDGVYFCTEEIEK